MVRTTNLLQPGPDAPLIGQFDPARISRSPGKCSDEAQLRRAFRPGYTHSDTDEGPDGETWLASPHQPISSKTAHLSNLFQIGSSHRKQKSQPPARFGTDYCGFQQPFANNESAAVCTAVPLKKSRFPEVQNSTALVKTMSRKASSLMTPCSTSS